MGDYVMTANVHYRFQLFTVTLICQSWLLILIYLHLLSIFVCYFDVNVEVFYNVIGDI